MAKILLWATATILVGVVACRENNKVPVLDPEEWWGPMELRGKHDTSIRRCRVKFEPEMINTLKYRLKRHIKWAPPLEDGDNFIRGFNSNEMNGWLSYWAKEYPFSEREAFFNQFPHFKTNIQGLDIHFIWARPQVPTGVRIVPLLLMHGWPGSVREFYESIPLLTRQTPGYDFVFEIIAPSLPGFGFSDGANRLGLGPAQIAVILRNLMKTLGFNQFYIQGGDWGAVTASAMSTLYPNDILGHHSNMVTLRNSCFNNKTSVENFPSCHITSIFSYLLQNYGYFHLQGTKPDTLGIALSDSPAGLLAYMLQIFSTWSNKEYELRKDGGLELSFTKEQLIDNLMVYWSTNCITTAIRLYAESVSNTTSELNLESYKTPVPTAFLQALHEEGRGSPELLRSKFTNLLHNTLLMKGGHFIALELPEVFAKDIFKAVKIFRGWHAKNYKNYDCSF